jgi:apolipoprotein N-acyltransferase
LALILQFVVFGALYGSLTRRWQQPAMAHATALALGWTALEWLTSLGAFGFTWGNLALSQVPGRTFIQVLDVVGPFPLAGAIVAVNGFLALTLVPWLAGHRQQRRSWVPAALALATVSGIGAYGVVRLQHAWPQENFSATIVQGNIAGSDKWTRGKGAIWRMADKYLALSASTKPTDVLLWPETAMPEFLRNNVGLIDRLRMRAMQARQTLIFGTLDWEGAGENLKLYNAVTAIDASGLSLGFDYKRHLVPYGEYVPARAWMPQFLMSLNIVGHDYYPGTRPHVFELGFTSLGAGVCYDGIFPDAMRPAVLAGATSIALVTNDAWYKDTAAPRVLLAHAALRAVENRRWVLRAANTGISAFIDPTGRIVSQTPVFKEAVLNGRAASIQALSVYTRWGDWASQLATALFFTWLGFQWTRRRRPL